MKTIYLITNLINGKQYIGQTSQSLKTRFDQHCTYSASTLIHNAIIEFGRENFIIEKLEELNDDADAITLEKQYILQYNTLTPNGYNVFLGQSNPNGANNGMKGKVLPPEWAQKLACPGTKNGRACYFKLKWLDTNEELIFELRQGLADYLQISISTVKKWMGIKHIDHHSGRPILFYNIGRINSKNES